MIDVSALEPWSKLWNVMVLLAPLVLFSFVSSFVIYLIFVVLFCVRGTMQTEAQGQDANLPRVEFGFVGQLSYLVLTALFGLALGMLVNLVGGFSTLPKDTQAAAQQDITGAVVTVLVLVFGVVGSLFAENGRIDARRPLGAISFLMSFLVSGFYWRFLRG